MRIPDRLFYPAVWALVGSTAALDSEMVHGILGAAIFASISFLYFWIRCGGHQNPPHE